jgi:serine/threonine-protein kinase RsbT
MTVLQIKEEADIVRVRSTIRSIASGIGFGLVDQTRISTAVSELARNVYIYAGEGEVHVEELANPNLGIRITFIDKGPGIEDIDLAMRDGWSSSGSLGKGLPGANRLMDYMDIQSKPGQGTTIIIEKWLVECQTAVS